MMRYSRRAMLKLSKIKAITLDLDDTLWPIRPTIENAEIALHNWFLKHAPKTANLSASTEVRHEIRSLIQSRHLDKLHDLSFLRLEAIRESLIRAGDAPELAEPAFNVFFAARQSVSLYQGVQQALEKLSNQYPLVSISNGNADVFSTPAAPYFKTAVSARLVGVAKPDIRIFEAAAASINLPLDEILHLGDDAMTDVMGARNAGMQSIWINTQNHVWTHESDKPLTVIQLLDVCDHILT